ncbi:hypothetical protein OC846_005442 [Tilletia horrida]|uniref:FHA domain-containing protein n=1 Tax=Tilletia horrida TaxID=155126 RepID=A0AAN6JPI5_9BASI|nr:hypothetical protein OC846_005442 [Tilletia horrida]KAK0561918.1 hypothetical protein OC861_005576 [Tilletia horrida]
MLGTQSSQASRAGRSPFAALDRNLSLQSSQRLHQHASATPSMNALKHASSYQGTSSPSKVAAIERRDQSASQSNTLSSPNRAITPTITFTEDPNAGLASDRTGSSALTLYGSYTHTLIIGRSKPSGRPHNSVAAATGSQAAASQSDSLVKSEVEALHRHSPSLHAGLKSALSSPQNAKHMRVCLPNDARHVSRVHALIHYTPFPSTSQSTTHAHLSPQKIPTAMLGSFLLRIIGQNGLYVNGQRLRADTVVTLQPGRTRLGFFGDVEVVFDVKADAMPAHIRSRALELQSHLITRVSSSPRTGSPTKKKSHPTLTTSPSKTNLIMASGQSCALPSPFSDPERGSQQTAASSARAKDARKKARMEHDGGLTPPPTSSPSRDSQDNSQAIVSQTLRPLTNFADVLSPPPSSSPLANTNSSRDASAGVSKKRKHRDVVPPSEDDSYVDNNNFDINFGTEDEGRRLYTSSLPSSPAAAASRRRMDEREGESALKSARATGRQRLADSEEEEERGSASDSDSQLSSASSLSPSPTPSPARRPAPASAAASSSSSSKKMGPPPVPVRSSARPNTSTKGAAGPAQRSMVGFGLQAPITDPIAFARGTYLQSAARRAVSALAPSYDLEQLLAYAIVFYRTATIAASEAVRSVLNGNPGLMRGEVGPKEMVTDGALGSAETQSVAEKTKLESFMFEHALANAPVVGGRKVAFTAAQWNTALTKGWREQLELVLRYSSAANDKQNAISETQPISAFLRRGPFVAIQRLGKDAAGNPLEPWYYYKPEADPDRERAQNFSPYVKPIRGALLTHKPIFWKKSAYGHAEQDLSSSGGNWDGGEQDEQGTIEAGGSAPLVRALADDVWGRNLECGVDLSASGGGGQDSLMEEHGLTESLVVSSGAGYSKRPTSAIAAAAEKVLKRSSTVAGAAAPALAADAPEGLTQGTELRVWGETQEEEMEVTYDKHGDQDYKD